MCGKSDIINTPAKFLSLMGHETTRVICDKFIDQSEKDWFQNALEETIGENFGQEMKDCAKECYFAEFLREAPEPTGEEAEDEEIETPRVYEEVESMDQLSDRLLTLQVNPKKNKVQSIACKSFKV